MSAPNEAIAMWAVMAAEKVRAGSRIDEVVATTAGMPLRVRESAAAAARQGASVEDVFRTLVPHMRFEDAAWCSLAAQYGRLDEGLARLAAENAVLGRTVRHFLHAAVYPLAIFCVGIGFHAVQSVFILKADWRGAAVIGLAASLSACLVHSIIGQIVRHRPWFLVPIARALPIARSMIAAQQWGRLVLATSWHVESGRSWSVFIRDLESALSMGAPRRFCRLLMQRTRPGHHPAEYWPAGASIPREVRALAPALRSGFDLAGVARTALDGLNNRVADKQTALMRLALPTALIVWSPAFYFLIKRMWLVTVLALPTYG